MAQPIEEENNLEHQLQRLNDLFQNFVNPPQRPMMRDHYNPTAVAIEPRVRILIGGPNSELKPNMIHAIPKFHGLNSEDPFQHIKQLKHLAQTFRSDVQNRDILLMKMFSFSLLDKAAHWYQTQTRPINTWEELQSEFLKKFFPVGRTNALRHQITHFTQQPGEPLHEAWDRFLDLMRKCPHHGVPKWEQVQSFYQGLREDIRLFVNATCGGNIMGQHEDTVWEILENMCENSINNDSLGLFDRTNARASTNLRGTHETQDLSTSVDLELMASRLDKVSIIEKKVDELTRHLQQATFAQNSFARPPLARETVQNIYHQPAKGMNPYPPPSTSRTGVTSDPFYSSWGNSEPSYSDFPEVPQNCEDLNAIQNDPYSNTYNPGWRNHPNFQWAGNSQKPPYQPRPQAPRPYQPPQPRPNPTYQSGQNQDQLTLILQTLADIQKTNAAMQKQHKDEITEVRNQLAQMANSRQPGTLPSQPLPNPNNVPTQRRIMNPNPGHAHLIYQAPATPSPDGMEASTSYAEFQQQPPLLPNPNQSQAGLNSVTTRSGKTTQDPHYLNHSKPDNRQDPRVVIQDTTVPDQEPGPILEEPARIPFPEALTK